MKKIDKLYLEEDKKIRILHESYLLADLLFLNYKYPNSHYYGNSIDSIYNSIHDKIVLNKKDEEKIINDALILLKIKYNIQDIFNN